MRKRLLIIGLSIILLSILATNVIPFDDYEGNHNDIECHGKLKETIKESKGIELMIQIIFSIIGLLLSITLSVYFFKLVLFSKTKK